jgi:hypothetical protein
LFGGIRPVALRVPLCVGPSSAGSSGGVWESKAQRGQLTSALGHGVVSGLAFERLTAPSSPERAGDQNDKALATMFRGERLSLVLRLISVVQKV